MSPYVLVNAGATALNENAQQDNKESSGDDPNDCDIVHT
jgi:hypothetical protein